MKAKTSSRTPSRTSSKSPKKRKSNPALKLWKKAREDVGLGCKKGEMGLCPKKGTAEYKKIKERYEELKEKSGKH